MDGNALINVINPYFCHFNSGRYIMEKDQTYEFASFSVETTFLLDGLKKGDELAFASLYDRYANLLLSYGTGLGFGREDIEDAIQEIFCNLYLHHLQVGEIRNLKFYLLRALKNKLLNICRVTMDTCPMEVEEMDFQTEVDILDGLIDEEERKFLKQKIESYLNTLTGRQREAIYLRYMEELDYEEIASLMGMTVPSVRNLVFRAVKQLRDSHLSAFMFVVMLSIVK